jgi:hypothetical protein
MVRLRALFLNAILVSCLLLWGCDKPEPPSAAEDTVRAGDVPAAVVAEDKGLEELERGARTVRLTGDLDAMLERGYIRVLVPCNKTFFFYAGARPRGLAYEFMEAFAEEQRRPHSKQPAIGRAEWATR